MVEVIVNTSPLQYLYQVGQLDLFPKLFGRITVPLPVSREIAQGRRLGILPPELERLDWVNFKSPASPTGGLMAWELGAGESGVLCLALENPGSWVVLDDKLARQAAVHLALPLLGTGGILLKAKQAGHLDKVGEILKDLGDLGFRLTPRALRNMLDLAGE